MGFPFSVEELFLEADTNTQERDFKSVGRTEEGGGFLGEAQRKREMSNCNRVYPGMFLVTLGILTHI